MNRLILTAQRYDYFVRKRFRCHLDYLAMCTVTYLPLGPDNFILTSNRDESPLRETLPPAVYIENGVKLVYPKDALAGGSWIGMSDQKRLVCLLNGGFEKHQRKPQYGMSRGVVVQQLLVIAKPLHYMDTVDLEDVEPFTVVFISWQEGLKTYQWVWDGISKHFSELPQKPSIWSSSPLYNREMKKERQHWFQDWLVKHPEISREAILKFHQNRELGTKTTAPVMDRLFVKTVSISSIQKIDDQIDFLYQDLKTGQTKQTGF